MAKKTAVSELKEWVKEKVPAAGTTEGLRIMQSVLGNIVYEIHKDTIIKEKEQLRDAFNKGVVYGMLLASTKNSNEQAYNGFDQYFKEKYGDEA